MGLIGSKQQITEQDRAILELKLQRDRITQYQKQLKVVVEKETEAARHCLLKGDKPRALLLLRKKKYQEQCLQKSYDQLLNLQKMADTLQFAVIQKDVFTHLKQGKDALEEINRQMRIEDIDKLTSENADAIAYQEEVSQMLGAKLTEQYEDEVEKEFAELEAEVIAESTRKLPSVPEHPIPKVDSELVQQDVGEAGQDREMPARALARSQAEEEEEEAEEEERQRVPMLA